MDIFSYVPDEVICHILSFLPTKCSAQTSVLSKRWKLLWTHVPLLEFKVDLTDYVNPNTITKILLQCKHDLHTFRLHGGAYFDGSQEEFQSLILEITTRNLHNLVVDVYNKFKYPQCLFTCKTLVDLSIHSCADFPTSGIYFPALKKINLFRVEYLSKESFDCLLSGSPVLEGLRIEGRLSSHYCVSSPILTSLELEMFKVKTSEFGVKIDTPALRFLRLYLYVPEKFSVGALDSLIEADINFYSYKSLEDSFTYSRHVLAFVGKLYNVETLTLSTNQTVVINDEAFFAFPTKFQNLTKLSLGSNLGFITSFLENANNLQCIDLNYMTVDTDNQYCWREPTQVPACLISRLKTVVCIFDCSEHEIDMMRYILMNGKVLKTVEVHAQPDHDSKKKSEALNTLALFERGSQECRLVLGLRFSMGKIF